MRDAFYPISSRKTPALNFRGAYPKPGKCPDCDKDIILTTPTKKCEACRVKSLAASVKKSKEKRKNARR